MPLYVVASPIGNLGDLSERAVATLREADVVAAEDTRRTGKLLAHLGLKKPLVAFYDAVEDERAGVLLAALARGQSVALVSDAGTPAVSDPGYRLIRAALEAGSRVVPIPGPSAVLAALVASGLPTDRFRFEGFVPRKAGARDALLDGLADEGATTVVFESPNRLHKTLDALAQRWPDREVCVARELTKLHEELVRGPARAVAATFRERGPVKGEVTLVVAGTDAPRSTGEREAARYAKAMADEGLAPSQIRHLLVRLLGLPRPLAFELTSGDED
jgi:16S rRNA (cytidine1402-2'-O)-methyltransferase